MITKLSIWLRKDKVPVKSTSKIQTYLLKIYIMISLWLEPVKKWKIYDGFWQNVFRKKDPTRIYRDVYVCRKT